MALETTFYDSPLAFRSARRYRRGKSHHILPKLCLWPRMKDTPKGNSVKWFQERSQGPTPEDMVLIYMHISKKSTSQVAPNHPVKLKYHSKQTPSFWCHEIWHHLVPNERKQHIKQKTGLGGGFNPFEKNIRQNEFIFPKLEVKKSKHMFKRIKPPTIQNLAHHLPIIPLISSAESHGSQELQCPRPLGCWSFHRCKDYVETHHLPGDQGESQGP